jgi:hypothetical protein
MKSEELERHVPCPEGGKVVFKKTTGPTQRKGEDYDSYFYDVLDSAGKLVGTYEVRDSMSTYPPFEQSIRVLTA